MGAETRTGQGFERPCNFRKNAPAGSYSIIGGGHADEDLDRGLDGGALEFGFTGRYFPASFISFGGEIRFHFPFYDRYHRDWDDNVHYSLDSSPDCMFLTLLFLTTFHFQAG